MESPNLHAILVAGLGHLNPILQLGNRLVTHHSIKVTVFIVTALDEHPFPTPNKKLNFIHLPPVDISDQIDPHATFITRIYTTHRAAKSSIRDALSLIAPRPDMIIFDMFGTESLAIAKEFNIPKYIFVPSTALFTALSLYCHVFEKDIEGQYADLTEPLRIPGCKPIRPEDLVEPMHDRNNQECHEYARMGIEFSQSDGILVNTWEDLERQTLDALAHDEILHSVTKVPVYPIGPLTKPVESLDQGNEIFEWLDKQPSKSVIYISFGSAGLLTAEQITELAWGLELSQHKFVWVVRPPVTNLTNAANDFYYFLPDGFSTRIRSSGILVPNMTQQMNILGHRAVGAFLSHCGWNSIIESLTNGVPMIAWPLYAEQKMNATMLVEDMGVAIRSEILPEKKTVDRDEIAIMIRTLMGSEYGKAISEKAMSLKLSAKMALERDGSSYNFMCQLIKDCQRSK